MAAELRHAVRSLRRAPGFLAASVLLLALAIAPTVGVFRLADVALLRQLSAPRPDELVIFEKVAMDGDMDTSFSYPVYRDLRDRAAGLSHVVAYDASVVALQSGDTTERVVRELVSGNYFQCLQTKAFLGRLLLPEDDRQAGAHPVAVLTYGYWRERFGGDAHILWSHHSSERLSIHRDRRGGAWVSRSARRVSAGRCRADDDAGAARAGVASPGAARYKLAEDHRPAEITCTARQAVEARVRTRLPESRQRGPRWRGAARHCSSGVARRTRETGSGQPRVFSAGFQVRPSPGRGARDDCHLVGRGRAELPLSVCRPFHRSARRTRGALGARRDIVQAGAGGHR